MLEGAFHFDNPMVVFNQLPADRQTEPGPLRFGREEGDKDLNEKIRANPLAGIAYGHPHKFIITLLDAISRQGQ